jgi:hypothetical protein
VAGCIWQRLFGHEKSMPKRIEAATRYELLIGFNPYAGDVKFCSIASSVGNR